jgi:hypothetical protein
MIHGMLVDVYGHANLGLLLNMCGVMFGGPQAQEEARDITMEEKVWTRTT